MQNKSTVFCASDLHFHHSNILKFNPQTRQHASIEAMNEALIRDWNSKVAPFSDVVYILGDFCFGSAEKAVAILKRLNGRKILVQGNHDEKLVQNENFRAEFESIHVYHEIKHEGKHVCMMHYPIAEWNKAHRGSFMLHGHTHGHNHNFKFLEKFRVGDVGVDGPFCNGSAVSKMDDVLRVLEKREIMTHGDGNEG